MEAPNPWIKISGTPCPRDHENEVRYLCKQKYHRLFVFCKQGFDHCSYIVEIRHGKHITAKDRPLFGLIPIAQIMAANKNV